MMAAAAVALFVIQNSGDKKTALDGRFADTEPLVCAPVEMSVTRQPMEVPSGAENRTSSYKSVVFTGKLAPRAVTVGAVPAVLLMMFQLPVLALIAIPILLFVVLVVGSTLVCATVKSERPTKARLPLANVSVANLVV